MSQLSPRPAPSPPIRGLARNQNTVASDKSREERETAEQVAVRLGRGQATKLRCEHCDGTKRGRHPGRSARAGGETCSPCCECGGYGYLYRIGMSSSPRSVPQLLSRRPQG